MVQRQVQKPMAQVGERYVFLLRKQDDGTRWPDGTKLYADVQVKDLARQAIDFTETVELMLYGAENKQPPTGTEVAQALYALRAVLAPLLD